MLLNRAYYFCKPFLPYNVRLFLRRCRASYRRKRFADVWPIDERAGATPPGWPGWPEGKRFAVVLTHDVEGQKGFDRIETLMGLEAKHGFRSSFNFVPIGEYQLSESLRNLLNKSGFEVGVHGLEHDGKLYSSHRHFSEKALRIREYLREWNACGFRSPLMQHNLTWIHELALEYDSSTFDTDPFEPEPDGVGTIFPFWVPGPNGTGYVELPYTFVQDFNLFKVLGAKTIDIWKQKLDWIAAKGGMALLNTHPDYMCFGGKPARDEFPVSLYEEFLQHVRNKFGDSLWSALPRDVSRYYCASLPEQVRNSRKKVCMVAYSNYQHDNRVRRYAEALARRGDQVDVIALNWGDAKRSETEITGVRVFGIQHREKNEVSKWSYAWRTVRFLVASSIVLTRRHRRIKYDVIHVHNMPDFLVFGAWYAKWTGARIILDIHDIVPELFVSKFGIAEHSGYVRALKWVEKSAMQFADHVIVSNDLWHEKLISRSVPREKCSVCINHVDPAVFYSRQRTRSDDAVVVLFPGSFQWHQGLDIAIRAFVHFQKRVPKAEFHLYGGGGNNTEVELRRLVQELGLDGKVKFCGTLDLEGIADVISNADLGVVPKRADTFGNEAYSTKIMEFMSQGVPVVASRTKIDSFYFDDSVVRFFPSGDDRAMAEAMIEVMENPELRKSLAANGREYAKRNSWDLKKNEYLALVDGLPAKGLGNSLLEHTPGIVRG